MQTAAVIPNWNGMRFLPNLFSDLQAQTRPFQQIVLVDNGSVDESADWAARQAGTTVVRFEENRGFAAAVNAGARLSGADTIAVLNNDLRLSANWLEVLTSGLGENLFAAGKVLSASAPSKIDGTWDEVSRGATAWRSGAGRHDGPEWSNEKLISFPPFTAVLLKRNKFLDLGGLDEAFGSYMEDVEFGLRCASKGHMGRYLPAAVAWHVGSATLGRWSAATVRQLSRNQLVLIARHYPPELIRKFGFQIAVAQMLWGLVALRHGRGGAWVFGKWDGVRCFRRLRGEGSFSVEEILTRSEQEIHRLQSSTGWDWYWRLYFALT